MENNIEKIIIKYLEKFPDEKDKLTKLIKLIKDNKDDYSFIYNRKNFQGHITASGYIYYKDDKKLLLLEHKALKKFLQPGGHVEIIDKEIVDTAKREVMEETGINNYNIFSISDDINVPIDINTHYIPKNEKKEEEEHYHHDFGYLFIIDKIENVKLDNNESNGYKWISIENLRNEERFKDIIRKIEELS